MRTGSRFAIVALVVSMLMILLPQSSVLASHNICNDNEFCLFKHINYNWNGTNPNDLCRQSTTDWPNYDKDWLNCDTLVYADNINDDTTSAKNLFYLSRVLLCRNANDGDPCSIFAVRTQDSDLSNNNVGNDAASSHNIF